MLYAEEKRRRRPKSILRLQLRQTIRTDAATLEEYDFVRISTENASGLVLLQNNTVFIHENFKCVLAVDFKAGTYLLGDQDASEFINSFYKSGRFHSKSPFLLSCWLAIIVSNVIIIKFSVDVKRIIGKFTHY